MTNAAAKGAINKMMTIRNWMLGYYIVEYEQNGKDRAQYGKRLLESLEEDFSDVKGFNATMFRYCRRFYQLYPQIASLVVERIKSLPNFEIQSTVLSELDNDEKNEILFRKRGELVEHIFR